MFRILKKGTYPVIQASLRIPGYPSEFMGYIGVNK